MAEKILEVKNLTKTYKSTEAVRNISFSIEEGEIVGLLGPNGAGKTTTINMVLGLLEPSSGMIAMFGKDLAFHRSEILQRVNFSAVYAQLPSNLTVKQNLHIFCLLYGAERQHLAGLMKEFQLEEFADIKCGLLSSGEQSRLNLAKAFINRPDLLLLDEPTASLDPSAAQTFRYHIMKYAKGRQKAVLWTSHNMHEIEEVCDRVLLMSRGKILLEGSPKNLPQKHGKKNLEELFISIARESLSHES